MRLTGEVWYDCITHESTVNVIYSGVVTGGGQGGHSATPNSKKFAKNREKEGKIRKIGKKEEESGRKGKNREGSFTFPLLTDTAGYATSY